MKSISINTLIIALAALVFMLVSIMIAQCMSREGVQNSSGRTVVAQVAQVAQVAP